MGRFLSSLSVFLRVCTYKYLYVFLSNCIGRSLCISLSLYRTISMYFCLIVHDDLSCISILLCAHDDLNGFLSMTFSLLGPKSRRGCSVSQSLVALAMFWGFIRLEWQHHDIRTRRRRLLMHRLSRDKSLSVGCCIKTSVTRWTDYLFNIWPFTKMKICPIA